MQDRSGRQHTRYGIKKDKPAFLEKKITTELYISIGNKTVPAIIDDISMSGFGFTIDNLDEAGIQMLEETEDFFVQLKLNDDSVVSHVKKVWTLRKQDEKGINIRGGASFDVISGENRKIIQKFVDKLHSIHGNL
ncbi:MAG: PilZ domain-containing protein [Spirochaetota bacterium]